MKWLTTKGKQIIDEEGKECILKGYAAGNWMIQEAFLFGTGGFHEDFGPYMPAKNMDRTYSINLAMTELCGETYTKEFWKTYHQNYLGKEDIRYLKKCGFNSLRLPLNAKFFIDDTFQKWNKDTFKMLDSVIDECTKNNIYVILDMHAALAGQSGLGCDDGYDNYPRLFMDEEAYEMTIQLWEKLAERYKENSTVAGYELLNEPVALPRWDNMHDQLMAFYKETIKRIRQIDSRHMIFLQGHRFSSRADFFEESLDNNWVMTLHIYETLPDLGLLGPILAKQEELNVPVWIGETGGNKAYMTVLVQALYSHGIGINVWVEKAVERKDAITLITYKLPEGFDKITSYVQSDGLKPSRKESIKIFDQYLENIKFENCTVYPDAANAILRQPYVSIPAIGYDFCKGNYPYCSFSGYRREDHMHFVMTRKAYEAEKFKRISFEKVPKYGDFNIMDLQLDPKEKAGYIIHGDKPIEISITYKAADDCTLNFSAKGNNLNAELEKTGSNYQTKTIAVLEGCNETLFTFEPLNGSVILHSIECSYTD